MFDNCINWKNFRVYLLCLFMAGIIMVVDLMIPLGVAGGVPYIAVILVSLWISDSRLTIYLAVTCSLLTMIGLIYSPASGELWKVLINRALALFAIWVTAMLALQRKAIEDKRLKAVEEREKALRDLKVLKGLLPICASCKSIRDDEGYWKQIEGYLSEHSEVEFSHGICPACTEKLYPDFVKKKQAKQS